MKLHQELVKILSKDERLIVDGKLAKNKVIELALQLDPDLLKMLHSSKELNQTFFQKVNDIFVFDKIKFQSFISNKQFLPNSFTEYKNKIGLISDKKYITDNEEVVLAFPYKDCVLEGGQTTDDAKRNEIFWNETLAPDEIDKLLNAKVFTNFQKYEKGKKASLEEITREDSLVIKGNNLITLYSLKKKYKNSIKLVYLDPPYNTPGEANTFSYNNSFNHSSWLTFMKNRIEAVKDLVSEDGFVCISIDDIEYAYLKVICDEVLGRDNFLATVVVQIKKEGRTDKKFFAPSHDYILFYCKNINKANINNLSMSDDNSKKWKEADNTGRFYWRDFIRTGGNSTPKDRPKQAYAIYYSKDKKEIIGVGGYSKEKQSNPYDSNTVFFINENGIFDNTSKDNFLKKHKNVLEVYPLGSKGENQIWRWSDREKVLWATKVGEIGLVENRIKIKDRIRQGSKPTTTWYDSEFNATSHGTLLLKKIFGGEKVFSYPKSLFTMMDIIDITTNKDDGEIVLDIFGGSATTAHAVHQMNQNDGGNRQYIICEQMDYAEDVTKERIRKITENDKNGSFIYLELAQSNQLFIEKIQDSKNTKELLKVWDEMKKTAFLSYKIKPEEIDASKKDFESLSFEDQQRFLISILDKNLLYIPYSEIDDKTYKISKEDKNLNNKFYDNK